MPPNTKGIWKSIVSGDYASDSAILNGYARKKVKRKNYPGLIEHNGSVVEGKIYCDVSEEDFRKLDAYEGEEYARIKVFVQLLSGKSAQCITYLFKKEYFDRLTKSEWMAKRSLAVLKKSIDTSYYENLDFPGCMKIKNTKKHSAKKKVKDVAANRNAPKKPY